MDWNIDLSSISDWIMSHSTVVVISIIAFFVLFLIYLAIINRESLSNKRMAELLKEDFSKNKKIPEGLGKKISKTHGMPRFFQEHKKDSSIEEPVLKPLILVVDDSKSALLAVTIALKDTPYRIVTALDGRVAWQKMIEERPSLVITDLEMPVVNGMELLRRMRADLRFLDVPVVLVTSHPFNTLKQGKEHGVNGFLAKPYMASDLREQVSFFLRESIHQS